MDDTASGAEPLLKFPSWERIIAFSVLGSTPPLSLQPVCKVAYCNSDALAKRNSKHLIMYNVYANK